MSDQKLVDNTVENSEPPSQTKTELAPETHFAGRPRRVMLRYLRYPFDSPEDVARQIVHREWQQFFDRAVVIDLDKSIRKLRLTQPYDFVKTHPQTFFRALVA